jgi:hypothetical protein
MDEIPGKKLSILEPKMAKISGEKLTKIEQIFEKRFRKFGKF